MSNILIIKHGSLGDIAQASGVIQDISENHKDDDVFILTTKPYLDLFRKNPYIKEPILDKRLSRFNPFYLYSLMRDLKKYNFLSLECQTLRFIGVRLVECLCQKKKYFAFSFNLVSGYPQLPG